ncbi:hypothetical protein GCM10028798_12740 [Humibacter antri]
MEPTPPARRTGSSVLRSVLDPGALLVAVIALCTFVIEIVTGGPAVERWVLPTAIMVQAVLLTTRRRAPTMILVAVSVCDAALLILFGGLIGTGALAVMIASYTVVAVRPRRRAYSALSLLGAGAAVVAACSLAFSASSERLIPAGWIVPVAVARVVIAYGVPAAVAEIVAARRRLVRALRERAELAEQSRERAAADAVRRQRASMARELHDIAAHHLTGIIVSTQAARALIRADPSASERYLLTSERETRTALDSIRQAVGLLRLDDGAPYSPQPSLDDIGRLVSDFPGGNARLSIIGEASGHPGPLAELAAYRMIQESLTNAARHAPGTDVRVELHYSAGSLRIAVANTALPDAKEVPHSSPGSIRAPRGAGDSAGDDAGGGAVGDRHGGNGLAGMRERAALLGGTLTTGPGRRRRLAQYARAAHRAARE